MKYNQDWEFTGIYGEHLTGTDCYRGTDFQSYSNRFSNCLFRFELVNLSHAGMGRDVRNSFLTQRLSEKTQIPTRYNKVMFISALLRLQ